MQDSGLGLRERQRRETLHHLHEAALALTLDGGIQAATVDAIAERAGVSRRTFFNYYASKEDAILGVIAPVVPEDALEAFFAAEDSVDPLTRTVRLIASIIASMQVAGGTFARRRELARSFPELKTRLQHHATQAQELTLAVLEEHLDTEDEAAADKARVLALLATSIIRFTAMRDPDSVGQPDSPSLTEAIATFREAIKESA